VAIGSFRVGLEMFAQARRMQRSVQVKRNRPFKDGEQVAVLGRIYPVDGQPIFSPFSKKECVFYTYDIHRWVQRRDSSGASTEAEKASDYSGLQLTPCYVQTPLAKVRLLAVPALEGFAPRTMTYSDQTDPFFQEAYRYTQSTYFDQLRMQVSEIGDIYALVKDLVTDDDGATRKDMQHSQEAAQLAYAFPEESDLRTRTLEETYVAVGEEVGLTGTWSAAKGGIVTLLTRAGAVLTRGSPKQAIRQTRWQAWKKMGEAAVAFGSINLIMGVFWIIVNIGPRYGTVVSTESMGGLIVRQETLPAPTMLVSPTDAAPSPVVENRSWGTYVNPAGKYSHDLPADWTLTETVNDDLNTPGEDILSVWSLARPAQEFPEALFSVSYWDDYVSCQLELSPSTEWNASDVLIAGSVVQARWRYETGAGAGPTRFQEFIMLLVANRCYQIEILDQEDRRNGAVLDRILASMAFVD